MRSLCKSCGADCLSRGNCTAENPGQGIPLCKLSGGKAGQCPGWPGGDSAGKPCSHGRTAWSGGAAAECTVLWSNDANDPRKSLLPGLLSTAEGWLDSVGTGN